VTLAPGTRLGPYEVLGAIGAGGMGEVYRAKDPRLARGVAVKVLPEEFFEGEERRQRFEREAKLLAALNHPNIAAIYSFEEIPSSSSSSSRHLLVMELVEGDDLARRISSGPLPLEESLSYARQIAEALEAAHEKGIVHRDLKPANVKVTPDGRVKLLDFGLAKIFESEASGSSPSISYSPTLTARGTAAGVILGTAAYMSPEQARGKSVDKRTDVWAFGCVLFEMLAGKRAFEGETVSDTLAAVLMKDPDWGALPEQTPAAVRKILRRCLQRDARLRLRDIGDARLELDELSARGASSLSAQLPFEENTALPGPTGGRSDSAASARGGRRLLFVSGALAAAFAAAAGALALRARAPRPADAVRLDMSVAPAERLGPTSAFQRPYLQSFALTPDGRRVVFAGRHGEDTHLYLRPISAAEAAEIPGTAGASSPFLSPDGRWVGFLAEGEIRKTPLAGGPVVKIAELAAGGLPSPSPLMPATRDFFGASWGDDDVIVFGRYQDGLWEVPAGGGVPHRLIGPKGEVHRLPRVLPGGKSILFSVAPRGVTKISVAAMTRGGEPKILVEDATDARFVPPDRLLFVREGILMAAPFDASRLALTGPAVAILSGVLHATHGARPASDTWAALYEVSASGTLVWASGGIYPREPSRLDWVDLDGNAKPLDLPAGQWTRPRISPDGKRVAVHYAEPSTATGKAGITLVDLERGTSGRLTEKDEWGPAWSADGKSVYFLVRRGGIGRIPADGSAPPEQIAPTDYIQPSAAHPDGSVLAIIQHADATGSDIGLLSTKDGTIRPWLATPANEAWPEFSPDGKWMAYASDVSGRFEVYVQPFPGPGPRQQVSIDGAASPLWSRDGKKLFFATRSANRQMQLLAVDVGAGAPPTFSRPRLLFSGGYGTLGGPTGYDVAPDGRRFLMVENLDPPPTPTTALHVVLNWTQELRRAGASPASN
jgi:Tol biopolymer transport system component